jgi:hypothetical protein
MEIAKETLFEHEEQASSNFKLVRLARTFRAVAIKNLQAHIAIMGCISRNSFLGESPYKVIDDMITRVNDKRDTLIGCGVWEKSIFGFIPTQAAPITEDLIVVTAKDTPPSKKDLQGLKVVPPQDPVLQNDEDDGPVEAGIVIDPFAEPSSLVVTKLEAQLWDDKGIGKKLPKFKLTLDVGATGIKEVGGELELFKQKLKEKYIWGSVAKVELNVTMGAKLQLDQDAANRIVLKWGGELKSSLEAEWKIPKTDLKLHVGAAIGVDTEGKPVKELELGVDF